MTLYFHLKVITWAQNKSFMKTYFTSRTFFKVRFCTFQAVSFEVMIKVGYRFLALTPQYNSQWMTWHYKAKSRTHTKGGYQAKFPKGLLLSPLPSYRLLSKKHYIIVIMKRFAKPSTELGHKNVCIYFNRGPIKSIRRAKEI